MSSHCHNQLQIIKNIKIFFFINKTHPCLLCLFIGDRLLTVSIEPLFPDRAQTSMLIFCAAAESTSYSGTRSVRTRRERKSPVIAILLAHRR